MIMVHHGEQACTGSVWLPNELTYSSGILRSSHYSKKEHSKDCAKEQTLRTRFSLNPFPVSVGHTGRDESKVLPSEVHCGNSHRAIFTQMHRGTKTTADPSSFLLINS